MPDLLIRYRVARHIVPEVVLAIEEAFAAVRDERPEGITYLYLHCPDDNEFIAVLHLDERVENPLPGIEAARKLQATVAQRAVGGTPAPRSVELIGSYGVLS